MSFPSIRPYHRLHLILLSVFYQPTFNHFDHFTSAFLLFSFPSCIFLKHFLGIGTGTTGMRFARLMGLTWTASNGPGRECTAFFEKATDLPCSVPYISCQPYVPFLTQCS